MKATLRYIYLCRTANMSWRTCVVVKQIQSNHFITKSLKPGDVCLWLQDWSKILYEYMQCHCNGYCQMSKRYIKACNLVAPRLCESHNKMSHPLMNYARSARYCWIGIGPGYHCKDLVLTSPLEYAENNLSSILHQYHCWWWIGNRRSQGISNHGIVFDYRKIPLITKTGLTHPGWMKMYAVQQTML